VLRAEYTQLSDKLQATLENADMIQKQIDSTIQEDRTIRKRIEQTRNEMSTHLESSKNSKAKSRAEIKHITSKI
jgi:flagellar basal body rod protein FlgF